MLILPSEPLCVLTATNHGKGRVLFEWDPTATFLASVGTSKVVQIFRYSKGPISSNYTQITPSGSGAVIALAWNHDSNKLAIVQKSSSTLELWDIKKWKQEQLTLAKHAVKFSGREQLSFAKFSQETDHLAVGTVRGGVYIYDCGTTKEQRVNNGGSGSGGRIVDTVWSRSKNRFAWITEDCHVYCCDVTGRILLKQTFRSTAAAPPTALTFGETTVDPSHDSLLCVQFAGNAASFEGRSSSASFSSSSASSSATSTTPSNTTYTTFAASTFKTTPPLLLFNVDANNGRGIDLEFRKEYGPVVSHHWNGSGTLIVGFLHGYVCGVECDISTIFSETFCVRSHHSNGSLRGMYQLGSLLACVGREEIVWIRRETRKKNKNKKKKKKKKKKKTIAEIVSGGGNKMREEADDDNDNKKEEEEEEEEDEDEDEDEDDDYDEEEGEEGEEGEEEEEEEQHTTYTITNETFNISDLTVQMLDNVRCYLDDNSTLDRFKTIFSNTQGMMTLSNKSGSLYTFWMTSYMSEYQENLLIKSNSSFFETSIGKVALGLAAPLELSMLLFFSVLGFLFVLCCTSTMMETTPWLFCRAVLGWSAFI